MRIRVKSLAVLASAVLMAAVVPSALAAVPPPSLSGVRLVDTSIDQMTASCNPSGTSTISYTTSGTASGAYAGTYTESGTVTIGPATLSVFVNGFQAGPVTNLDATFTINSAAGAVSGTKHLDLASVVPGFCYDFADRALPGGSPVVTGTFRQVIPSSTGYGLTYSANIVTADGVWTDSGISGVLFSQFTSTASSGTNPQQSNVFDEAYSSTGLVECALTMSAILPPFNADGSSIWKYGSTVPVKVRITDCNGASVAGLSPQVGTQLWSGRDPSAAIGEATSTSAADTGSIMRYDATAGQYIYNWASKSVSDGNASYVMFVRQPLSVGRAPDGSASPGQSYQSFALKTR